MNPYKTLGVQRDASTEEIKAAYRRAVAIHHPDRGGSASIFVEVQKAYELLGDTEKRKAFDDREQKKPVESLRGSVEKLVEEYLETCTQN